MISRMLKIKRNIKNIMGAARYNI